MPQRRLPTVELVYDRTCPNVEVARLQLLRAFAESRLTPHWREWEATAPDTPVHVRGYGSPTILIDGKDVAGEEPAGMQACCRLYWGPDRALRGVPSVEQIRSALRGDSGTPGPTRGWRLNLPVLPSLGLALLPKLAYPACWPAYAGLLSAMGLGFLIETRWLLSLTVLSLVVALGALVYRAGRRHGYGPWVLGSTAAALMLWGKFGLDGDAVMYVGIALLGGASLWNSWPDRAGAALTCTSCTPSADTASSPLVDWKGAKP